MNFIRRLLADWFPDPSGFIEPLESTPIVVLVQPHHLKISEMMYFIEYPTEHFAKRTGIELPPQSYLIH